MSHWVTRWHDRGRISSHSAAGFTLFPQIITSLLLYSVSGKANVIHTAPVCDGAWKRWRALPWCQRSTEQTWSAAGEIMGRDGPVHYYERQSVNKMSVRVKGGVWQCKCVGNKTCIWWLFAPSVCFVVKFWVSDIIPGQPSATLVCKHANSRPSDPESRSAPVTSRRGKFCWCMSTFPVAFSYIPLSPLSARTHMHS